jgi:methylase of polypeptide subunit release factors
VFSDQESVELAKVFNPPFILHSSLISKTLRESMVKRQKKLLLFEGGKSKNIEENVVEEGLNGLKRVISHLGMRNYKIDISKEMLKTSFYQFLLYF